MEKRIKISYDLSVYVERLFFEYNASMRILRYLASQDDVKQENLDKYFEEAKNIEMELELAKKEISDKYKPEGCFCEYYFDFDACEIVYTGGGCRG